MTGSATHISHIPLRGSGGGAHAARNTLAPTMSWCRASSADRSRRACPATSPRSQAESRAALPATSPCAGRTRSICDGLLILLVFEGLGLICSSLYVLLSVDT